MAFRIVFISPPMVLVPAEVATAATAATGANRTPRESRAALRQEAVAVNAPAGELDHWLVRDPIRTAVIVILLVSLAVRFSVVKDSFFITDDYAFGHSLERERQQRIARQQRQRFAEDLVAGRAPAPQIIVVHARQVVMNQRIGVDQFDSAADDVEVFRRGAGQLASSVGE